MAKTKQRSSTASQRREDVRKQRQQRLSGGQGSQSQARNQSRRRSKPNRGPWGLIVGVLLIIAAVIGVFIYLSHQSSSNTTGPTRITTDATTFKQVTNVDPALLSQIGTGGIPTPFKLAQGSPPLLLGPTGKPEIFFWGGEFCPLCAAERWGVVVAMSRFGTFHTLKEMTSASDDSYPSTSTFTFYQSSYTSSYVDFVPVEAEDQQRAALQNPTASEQQLVNTYDAPPYIDAQYAGGFPFMNIGNRYLILGPSYDPAVLRTNAQDPNSQPLTQQEIADQLSSVNAISKNVLGTANYLTAAICMATNQQPGSVCTAAPIPAIEHALTKAAFQAGGTQVALAPGQLEGVTRERD